MGVLRARRVGRFEEAIAIIGPLLGGERVTLAGSYYQVRDAVLRPPPERPILILLLVAAKGRRMLRLTARYADAWNTAWFGLPDELLHRRLAELNAALEAEGRDPATLRRTVGMEVRDPQAADSVGDLGVVAREVVDSADGWAAAEGGVGAVHVVPVDPGQQGAVAGGVGAVQPLIGPLLEQGPVEPLHLPIRLRPVGSGALVTHAGVGQRGPEQAATVTDPVVGQHPGDGDAV